MPAPRRSSTSGSAWRRSGGTFDVERKRSRIALIERDAGQPDFWSDNVKAQALLKEKATLESTVGEFDRTLKGFEDAQVLADLAEEANDESARREAAESLHALEAQIEKLEFERMLSAPDDRLNAFMEINAGAGGA